MLGSGAGIECQLATLIMVSMECPRKYRNTNVPVCVRVPVGRLYLCHVSFLNSRQKEGKVVFFCASWEHKLNFSSAFEFIYIPPFPIMDVLSK